MRTIVCTADYAKKIVDMKKQGLAGFVTALVVTDHLSDELSAEANS